jgi:serine protease Do
VGDPAKLEAGDWVLAVGGPATGGAVTAGIVSTKGRLGKGALAGIVVLESDVTLGEGMEGGPLVNLEGQVVGMTAGGPNGRGRQLTTVVPASTVVETVRALGEEGKVRRGFLGVRYGPLEQDDRERLGLRHGVKVQEVVPGSPAADAGFQVGDIILEFGGVPLADTMAFRAMVAGRKPGTRVAVKLSRGGEEINTEVTLGEMPEQMAAPRPPQPPVPGAPEPALPAGEKLDIGLSLQPLTAELAEHFGFAGRKGLLVTGVDAKGAAAKARPRPIRKGELVAEAGGKPVAAVAKVKAAIAAARKADQKTLLLLVRSREGVRYTVVDLAH